MTEPISLASGVGLLVAAAVLMRVFSSDAGEEHNPSGWFANTAPMLVLVFGALGIVFLAKGFFG